MGKSTSVNNVFVRQNFIRTWLVNYWFIFLSPLPSRKQPDKDTVINKITKKKAFLVIISKHQFTIFIFR